MLLYCFRLIVCLCVTSQIDTMRVVSQEIGKDLAVQLRQMKSQESLFESVSERINFVARWLCVKLCIVMMLCGGSMKKWGGGGGGQRKRMRRQKERERERERRYKERVNYKGLSNDVYTMYSLCFFCRIGPRQRIGLTKKGSSTRVSKFSGERRLVCRTWSHPQYLSRCQGNAWLLPSLQ